MIERLRKKLIVAAIGSLLLVLVVILGCLSGLYIRDAISDIDHTLMSLAATNDLVSEAARVSDNERVREAHDHGRTPESYFETEYFFITLDSQGTVTNVYPGTADDISVERAEHYAESVLQSGDTRGFLDDYRYLYTQQNGNDIIIFVDCERSLESFWNLLVTGVLLSLIGTALVFVLLLFFSKRIVRPFAEIYDKQKRFITDAGHELKTPLSIIAADAEVLTMDIGQNEWVDEITNQTQRLTKLTNDLIFLARTEEALPTQMASFSLSQLMTDTVQSFEAVAKTQDKTIDADIPAAVTLYGDERALQKVLTILLDNALKYMPAHETVRCGLTEQRAQVQLWVGNPCAPMSDAQISRLFDRFYRADASRNSKTGGYGLGLSIAKAIVSAHKGRITASAPSQGTLLITVTLPKGQR
ncbi:MAG: HAMP domain-containing sensor histidine kinase [Peptococcaceae bacterium]|nr:HAMP domain-containing sensor histidine kinase [Peptococcaceae bacterium]